MNLLTWLLPSFIWSIVINYVFFRILIWIFTSKLKLKSLIVNNKPMLASVYLALIVVAIQTIKILLIFFELLKKTVIIDFIDLLIICPLVFLITYLLTLYNWKLERNSAFRLSLSIFLAYSIIVFIYQLGFYLYALYIATTLPNFSNF